MLCRVAAALPAALPEAPPSTAAAGGGGGGRLPRRLGVEEVVGLFRRLQCDPWILAQGGQGALDMTILTQIPLKPLGIQWKLPTDGPLAEMG